MIRVEHLPPTLRGDAIESSDAAEFRLPSGASLDDALEQLERRMLCDALAANEGNRAAAARALGISERRIGLRVRKYGLG